MPFGTNVIYLVEVGGANAVVLKSVDGATFVVVQPSAGWFALGGSANPAYVNENTGASKLIVNAGGGGGLFMSLDGGTTWTSLTTPITFAAMAILSSGRLAGWGSNGTTASVYTSDDNGSTWTLRQQVTGSVNQTQVETDSLWEMVDGSLFVVITDGTLNKKYIYKSSDKGVTWSQKAALAHGFPFVVGTAYKVTPNGPVALVAVSATDANESYSIAYSFDNGSTWATQVTPLFQQNVAPFESDMGSPWHNLAALCPDGSWITYGSINRYRSTTNGATWVSEGAHGFANPPRAVWADTIQVVYTALNVAPYKLHKSTDNGHTWSLLRTGSTSINFVVVFAQQLGPVIVFPRSTTGLPIDIASSRNDQSRKAYQPVVRVY